MKKQITYALFFSLISCSLAAQTTKITRQVIGSSGRSIGNGMSFTFGEAIVGTAKISNGYVTQGFQQPIDDGIRTSYQDVEPPINASIYPNPSAGFITIAVETKVDAAVQIQVFNVLGQLIQSTKTQQQLTALDLANCSAGLYLIRLSQKGKKDFTKQVVLQR